MEALSCGHYYDIRNKPKFVWIEGRHVCRMCHVKSRNKRIVELLKEGVAQCDVARIVKVSRQYVQELAVRKRIKCYHKKQ